MIIVMKANSTAAEIGAVIARIQEAGASPHPIYGVERTVVAVVGETRAVDQKLFLQMPGVETITSISAPYKLASRESHADDTVIEINGTIIGGKEIVVMAGPCSVESRTQLLETAHAVKEAGAQFLRGGAFKPRSSPYAFQGMGLKGLEILAEAREIYGLDIVTEVMTPEAVPMVAEYADILQIGARNTQNYGLLHAVGRVQRPVLLKRGMMSSMEELLMSAEYILAGGNYRVMLCERVSALSRNTPGTPLT